MTLYTADDYILARLGWHDAICPEGEDCRDRNIHALSAGGACPLEAILDAVLPAYRKRLLRELADEMVRKAVFETAAGNLISLYDALTVLGFDPLTFKADEVEGVSE